MSKNKDILLKMLAEEPKLYEVINSKEHTLVLKILQEENQDFQYIKNALRKDIYIKKDIILYNILDTLIGRELVKKINVNDKEFYFLTDKGLIFYKIYSETKKEFNLI